MAKECKDFTYLGKKLSELSAPYISVDFDREKERDLALSRSIEYTGTTSSRTEPSVKRAAHDNHLTFEIHLIKDPEKCSSEEDRIITEAQLRELTRWLTSTDTSQYLKFDYHEGNTDDTCLFFGQFTDIQTFLSAGDLYGLRLIFECSTCYGYTDEITKSFSCQGSTLISVFNHSDDLNHYRYPKLTLTPDKTGQAYLVNLSDCIIYESGQLSEASGNPALLNLLKGKLETYALSHGLAVLYQTDALDSTQIVTLGDDTALQFRFCSTDGTVQKCAAFYSTTDRSYYIIRGGFLCLNVHQSLPIHLDAEHVTLFDDIGRMITYASLGISDVDYFYWPRLLNGENKFLFYAADCSFTLSHRELRKAGA